MKLARILFTIVFSSKFYVNFLHAVSKSRVRITNTWLVLGKASCEI
jgi:hypothetical protein